MTFHSFGPDDWDDQKKDDDNEEDLQALGMTITDSDEGVVEDDEDAAPAVVAAPADEDEEPLDGLAALEKLEKELEVDEVDLGEDE